MSCQCESCLYNHDATRRMEKLSEDDRQFFDTMLETLRNTELDRDVMSCVLDGSWPSALEQITTTAKILGYKLVPLDSTT